MISDYLKWNKNISDWNYTPSHKIHLCLGHDHINILLYQFADVLRSTNCCYSVGHSEAAVVTTYKALIPQSEKANTQYTKCSIIKKLVQYFEIFNVLLNKIAHFHIFWSTELPVSIKHDWFFIISDDNRTDICISLR